MTHSTLDELLSYTREHAGPSSAHLASFVAAYFDNTDPDELQARGTATLFAIANAHWRLLDAARPDNTAKVRVFNPTLAEDGFVSEHTVVQIVNDNMPFLVDSVTMAINRGNRTAHWIVHPLMSVTRDAQGKVMGISSAAAATVAGRHDPVESIIQVECDRIVTISADVNYRSPNPDFDEGDLAYWKIGAGAGLEMPLRVINAIVRGGYSWKELDCYPYAVYSGNTLKFDKSIQTSAVDNLQMITGGVTFILSRSITFEAAKQLTPPTT